MAKISSKFLSGDIRSVYLADAAGHRTRPSESGWCSLCRQEYRNLAAHMAFLHSDSEIADKEDADESSEC